MSCQEAPADGAPIDEFIRRWSRADGAERSNYQLFLTELCTLLDLPQPDPAREDTAENTYVFERRVDISNPDGTTTWGFIDLYRAGCFVLEAKQTGKALDTAGWDKAMLAAHNQADQYAKKQRGQVLHRAPFHRNLTSYMSSKRITSPSRETRGSTWSICQTFLGSLSRWRSKDMRRAWTRAITPQATHRSLSA